jgi:hypothetical protein
MCAEMQHATGVKNLSRKHFTVEEEHLFVLKCALLGSDNCKKSLKIRVF